MKLTTLKAQRYRSLWDGSIAFTDLNLFIGTNASGKSTILDALRFLQEGIEQRDFREAISSRGGILHLAWKGEEAREVKLEIELADGSRRFEWSVILTRDAYDFSVREDAYEYPQGSGPVHLLNAVNGRGWWWSEQSRKISLAQDRTACALAAAAADATFPARGIVEFIKNWGFFDPNPLSLRRGWPGLDATKLDPYGRNLAERLYAIRASSPKVFQQIVTATQSVLGLPTELEPRETEGRFYFAQREPGLQHWVHQVGASSGTLRMLALMTALLEESGRNLVGIEEPENHIHPKALAAFADYLWDAQKRTQILVTTHSPLLLDYLNEPSAVCVVSRDEKDGTRVIRESNPSGVCQALMESGFGLGEYYETKGFGA